MKTEILAIFNKYKNTLKNLIDSSDIEPLIIPSLVSKGPYKVMAYLEVFPIKHEMINNFLDRLL